MARSRRRRCQADDDREVDIADDEQAKIVDSCVANTSAHQEQRIVQIPVGDHNYRPIVDKCCTLCRDALDASLDLPGAGEGILLVAFAAAPDELAVLAAGRADSEAGEGKDMSESGGRNSSAQRSRRRAAGSARTSTRTVSRLSVDDVVGFVVLRWMGGNCRIAALAVVESRRREGHGIALVERAIHEAEERGCRQVSLHVRDDNKGAQALYGRVGFKVSRRISSYYDDGEDALLLQRSIVER